MGVMEIVSVNTGPVALLGERRGRPVYSGIRKMPVIGGTPTFLGIDGLDDDEQADLRVHGSGKGKAVYVYPRNHYELWVPELNTVLVPGDFGENLTIDGVTEDDVLIGERWRWGEALLEVTGPRSPCFKLNLLRGDGTAEAMMRNGRCGWYFKVLTPGHVPTVGELELEYRPAEGTTIAARFREKARRKPDIPDIRDED
jgi:MOSC domain-containing protein YiiM